MERLALAAHLAAADPADRPAIERQHCWTLNCLEYDKHGVCTGYVAPKVYAQERPCLCPCHTR